MKKRLFLLAVLAVLMVAGAAHAGTTEPVSVDSSGTLGNGESNYSSISADGNFVAFLSLATNLVSNVPSGYNVYVHDMTTGATEHINTDSNGDALEAYVDSPSLSADGRYVAFIANVPAFFTSGVYVKDRATGQTELASVNNNGEATDDWSDSPSMSADGRYVAFKSYGKNLVPGITNATNGIYVRDRTTGQTEIVSVDSNGEIADDWSGSPSISADGRYVAFVSYATNLVPDDTNNLPDIFVHDRSTGATERVSLGINGNQADNLSDSPSISADGRYVAFRSYAANLVPGDFNGFADIFMVDRVAGTTEIVSVDSSGDQADDHSFFPSVSADGRYVALVSYATNLVPGDTNGKSDIFVHDMATGLTERVNLNNSGNQTDDWSNDPSISGDGRHVAFESRASNLVSGDLNSAYDIFSHDRYGDADNDGVATPGDCNDYDGTIYPGAAEVKHDGIDQDCNGYDLTIEITSIRYQHKKDKLTVQATSDYGQAANLVLDNYSMPMSWTGTKWEAIAEPAGGLPATITVSGPEGSETVPTN